VAVSGPFYAGPQSCQVRLAAESKLAPDEEQKADLSLMMKDLEALLARMG
jgi:hypothetical protein